jgi:hypothetical protein
MLETLPSTSPFSSQHACHSPHPPRTRKHSFRPLPWLRHPRKLRPQPPAPYVSRPVCNPSQPATIARDTASDGINRPFAGAICPGPLLRSRVDAFLTVQEVAEILTVNRQRSTTGFTAEFLIRLYLDFRVMPTRLGDNGAGSGTVAPVVRIIRALSRRGPACPRPLDLDRSGSHDYQVCLVLGEPRIVPGRWARP